jgi:regulator of nucleoside diphosphate kinase
MRVEKILVTEPDMRKLTDLLEEGRRWPGSDREHFAALRRKLEDVGVVAAEKIHPDIVTLHSRVRVKGLDEEGSATHTLVMPAQAWAEAGMISVLSPMGASLLGARPGDEIEWRTSDGIRRARVEGVFYQPEAAAYRSPRVPGQTSENGLRRPNWSVDTWEQRT